MKITNYKEFLLEKEFQRILESFRLITESEDAYKLGDTIEWDLKKDKGTPDEPATEMEWTFKPKSKIQKAKDKVSDFTGWLREDDPEIDWSDFSDGVNPNNPIIMFKNFIEKIKDKEKIKEYFIRVIKQLKLLPTNIKRNLLKKLLLILAVYCNTINVPLSNIVTSDVTKTEPITAEIMTEIESGKEQQPTNKIKLSKEVEKFASFDRAQNLVKSVEAGYSDDKADTGNYIKVQGGQRFIGTNHGISAPILAQYFKDKGIERMITKQDMMDLTYETALEIYKKDYWDAQGLSNFKSQSIANVLYDGCVNQGAGATLGVIKKSINSLGYKTDTIGNWNEFHEVLTPKINKLSTKETKNLFDKIKEERLEKYKQADTWENHGRGWTDRLEKLAFEDSSKESDIT